MESIILRWQARRCATVGVGVIPDYSKPPRNQPAGETMVAVRLADRVEGSVAPSAARGHRRLTHADGCEQHVMLAGGFVRRERTLRRAGIGRGFPVCLIQSPATPLAPERGGIDAKSCRGVFERR